MGDAPARPATSDRRARGAVAALFLTNGALFANILPRFPEIKASLGLGNAAYGVAVAAFPAGAIVAGLAAAVLIRRFGSAKVAVTGTLVTAVGMLVAGIAPTVVVFASALFFAGASDAVTDVGQNAHALRVQRRYGRTIINSFHAVWSIGAVLGGSMAASAIALDIPIGLHLSIAAILFSTAAMAALRFTLPGHDDEARGDSTPHADDATTARRAGPSPRTVIMLIALVLIAIAGTVVEEAGNSWAALYLSESLNAPAAIAATGYVSLVGAQFLGRLLGDRLVDRFGQRAVARAGGLIVALGMGLALAVPNIPGTVLGFAAAGFGVATLVPAAMQEADELPGLRHGTGLTIVSWLMRLGFLLSPPVVGLIADATSLRVGLLTVPAAGIAVMILSGVLSPRHHPKRVTTTQAPTSMS